MDTDPTTGTVDIKVIWRDVPTLFVDQVIGFTGGGGVARITFGELAFQPEADLPVVRPNITIAATKHGIVQIIKQLTLVAQGMDSSDIGATQPAVSE